MRRHRLRRRRFDRPSGPGGPCCGRRRTGRAGTESLALAMARSGGSSSAPGRRVRGGAAGHPAGPVIRSSAGTTCHPRRPWWWPHRTRGRGRGQHRRQSGLSAEPVRGGSQTLTVDDSWAQDRIAEGMASDLAYAHPDAHIITRGSEATPIRRRRRDHVQVSEPGLLVVCSDGLWNYFEDPDVLGRPCSRGVDASGGGPLPDGSRPRGRGPGQHHGRRRPDRAP